MKDLFRYKDIIPFVLRASVVYQFKCGGCSASYVGQTGRHLRTRINEHLGISSSTGQPIKTNSAVFDHMCQTGHVADNTCFSAICSVRSKSDLPIIEHYQIRKLKPDLNRQSDFSAFYLI